MNLGKHRLIWVHIRLQVGTINSAGMGYEVRGELEGGCGGWIRNSKSAWENLIPKAFFLLKYLYR